VRHDIERATTDRRFQPMAAATHSHCTCLNASPSEPTFGWCVQKSTPTTIASAAAAATFSARAGVKRRVTLRPGCVP
jgi:hypothetical protein